MLAEKILIYTHTHTHAPAHLSGMSGVPLGWVGGGVRCQVLLTRWKKTNACFFLVAAVYNAHDDDKDDNARPEQDEPATFL